MFEQAQCLAHPFRKGVGHFADNRIAIFAPQPEPQKITGHRPGNHRNHGWPQQQAFGHHKHTDENRQDAGLAHAIGKDQAIDQLLVILNPQIDCLEHGKPA
eukprot:NODE_10981_length_473_cov_1.861272_g10958_i0.p1 GENE.NODE_10981_length_473_cov_1.861272_g10958_i0~~NODE_10981_length_473_cov_1.861272_g10958_i0.p1  ORF type:complete len:101 (-),score=1.50 NODE_10981_length_473_cov_1.861272_g10958_i0:42-344(-)